MRSLACLLLVTVAGCGSAEDVDRAVGLEDLFRGKDFVLASHPAGLFRSSLAGEAWERVSTPPEMPAGGKFVASPEAAKVVFYFLPAQPRSKKDMRSLPVKLFTSEDAGRTWRLANELDGPGEPANVTSLFRHRDGVLYALAGRDAINTSQIWRSRDDGRTWSDITGPADSGGLYRIFPDPDHPNLVCLGQSMIRGYVWQADDDRYRWEIAREWEWEPTDRVAAWRRRDESYGGESFRLLGATLANYFDLEREFDGKRYARAERIETDREEYHVRRGEPIAVKVRLREVREDIELRMADDDHSEMFWKFSVLPPAGAERTFPAGRPKPHEEAGRSPQEIAKLWAPPRAFVLKHARAHERKFRLDRTGAFDRAGRYLVRISYGSDWLSPVVATDCWRGHLPGQVFQVVVE